MPVAVGQEQGAFQHQRVKMRRDDRAAALRTSRAPFRDCVFMYGHHESHPLELEAVLRLRWSVRCWLRRSSCLRSLQTRPIKAASIATARAMSAT